MDLEVKNKLLQNIILEMSEDINSKYNNLITVKDQEKAYNLYKDSDKSIEDIKDELMEILKKLINSYLEQKDLQEKIIRGEIIGNWPDIKSTIIDIFKDDNLKNKLSIYGGTIPYILTGETPKRIIGDIDTHADIENMNVIREYINNNPNNFTILSDSLELCGEDYGIEILINGINVSIFPTIKSNEGMIVKNFSIDPTTNEINTKSTVFPNINENDEIVTHKINDSEIRLMSPEFTYITKQAANREKDLIDISVLEKIIDKEKVEKMKFIMGKPYTLETPKIDIKSIQTFLNENARNYLQIIGNEYGQFMNPKQLELMQKLLVSDNVIVEENGDKYLENQKQCFLNDSSLSEEEKQKEIAKLKIPAAHGSKVFEDGKIHFYPIKFFEIRKDNKILTTSELKKKCDEILIHELLHYFIAPEYMDIENPSLRKINSYTAEGLVDMCARDLQQKYNLNPDYTSNYGSNVVFIREALNNINDPQERMKIVFQGSMEEIFNKTTTENYDSKKEVIDAYNRNTAFDQMIINISPIFSQEEPQKFKNILYNLSANCQNKKDAINTIAEKTEEMFPDKKEQVYPHLNHCEEIENQKIKTKQGEVRKLVPQNLNYNNQGYISYIILTLTVIFISLIISLFILIF